MRAHWLQSRAHVRVRKPHEDWERKHRTWKPLPPLTPEQEAIDAAAERWGMAIDAQAARHCGDESRRPYVFAPDVHY